MRKSSLVRWVEDSGEHFLEESTMKCPRCQGTARGTAGGGGVEIDVGANCRGGWRDRAELRSDGACVAGDQPVIAPTAQRSSHAGAVSVARHPIPQGPPRIPRHRKSILDEIFDFGLNKRGTADGDSSRTHWNGQP